MVPDDTGQESQGRTQCARCPRATFVFMCLQPDGMRISPWNLMQMHTTSNSQWSRLGSVCILARKRNDWTGTTLRI